MPPKHSPKSGRKRTVFCDSCKINPIPVKQCLPCKRLYERNLRSTNSDYHKQELERRRKFYRENTEYEKQRKAAWKNRNPERWDKIKKNELDRKDRVRYGEFALAHRAFINLKQKIKELKNESK